MNKINNAQSILRLINILHKHDAKTYDCKGDCAIQHAAGYANAYMDMDKDINDDEAAEIFRMIIQKVVLEN